MTICDFCETEFHELLMLLSFIAYKMKWNEKFQLQVNKNRNSILSLPTSQGSSLSDMHSAMGIH